jgi:hypothetical protein
MEPHGDNAFLGRTSCGWNLKICEETTMKRVRIIQAAVLLMFFGIAVPAYARQEQHQKESKPAQESKQGKPAQQGQHNQHAQQAEPSSRPQEGRQQAQQAKPAQQQHAQQSQPSSHAQDGQRQQQAQQSKPAQQQNALRTQQGQHQQQAQERGGPQQQRTQRSSAEEQRQRSVPALRLSARGSARIPDQRFHANFGRGHEFRIGSPTMVGGYSRFQYGGFWFGFVQPWPVGWYYTDDVYVDYIGDGYYLCNAYDPGVRVAISVVL